VVRKPRQKRKRSAPQAGPEPKDDQEKVQFFSGRNFVFVFSCAVLCCVFKVPLEAKRLLMWKSPTTLISASRRRCFFPFSGLPPYVFLSQMNCLRKKRRIKVKGSDIPPLLTKFSSLDKIVALLLRENIKKFYNFGNMTPVQCQVGYAPSVVSSCLISVYRRFLWDCKAVSFWRLLPQVLGRRWLLPYR